MGDTYRKELTDRYVFVMVHLNRLLYRGVLEEAKKLNLNILQMHTIIMLNYDGPQRMGSVSNYLGSTLSRATTLVDNLVRKDYVKRGENPNDRRGRSLRTDGSRTGSCNADFKHSEAAIFRGRKPVGFETIGNYCNDPGIAMAYGRESPRISPSS